MEDMFDMLAQTIEEAAFPACSRKAEYHRQVLRAERNMEWLEEHLEGEARTHWEQATQAQLRAETLEREAIIRTAIAAGIRLALPG